MTNILSQRKDDTQVVIINHLHICFVHPKLLGMELQKSTVTFCKTNANILRYFDLSTVILIWVFHSTHTCNNPATNEVTQKDHVILFD